MRILWATVGCFLATAAVAQDWSVPPRSLPPPVFASPELQAQLSATPSPDVAAAIAAIPASPDEVRATEAAAVAAGAQAIGPIAEAMGVTLGEQTIAGVPVYTVTPAKIDPRFADHLFFYIHGGAFVKGGGPASSFEAVLIAANLGIPAVSVDYRMAPDHPAPAAMEDLVAVWQEVIKTRDPAKIAMGGTSAGANLTLVTNLKIKELGLPHPGALFVGTPPIHLGRVGDTRFLVEGADRYLVSWDSYPQYLIGLYVGEGSVEDPYLSPWFGDVTGFPPTYLISGTRDLMLSDTAAMHRKLRRAGVEADLHVYEGHSHGDYILAAGTPETAEHMAELDAFLRDHLAE
jgi:epsilon-lactone hydrolase